MPRGPILLARHPRPIGGARICLGRRDVPLAEPAAAAAERLLAAAEPIERIVSSPLRRAMDVARLLALWTGATLHADDRLIEQDLGDWDGRPWTSLDRAAWDADPLGTVPPGGESLRAVLGRVRHAWPRIASAEETTLVLTHLAPLRCLLHLGAALPLEAASRRGIGYGEVVRLP